jgi:predicted AlkP superfamily pyrophosphatase or phosphodiesterase
MKNKGILFLIIMGITLSGYTQPRVPKLVVGIVVDQMRPDYLNRFIDDYGSGGFKRLISNGFTLWNVHYNYIPTYTGPGHASIYSGTTPRYHGVIGNDIYYRDTKKVEYCVKDSFDVVGNEKASKGKGMSPHRLITTNICDELKLSDNNHSKVISISLKDRAAILSGGHIADNALWFDQETGNFISSSFYSKELPMWVKKFNGKKLADSYIQNDWIALLGNDRYSNCVIDTTICAITRTGSKVLPVFPHSLQLSPKDKDAKYSLLYKSPLANSLLTDLAIETIKNTGIGTGNYPDFLAISYSSTDAVGHLFGPLSKEIKDTYVRLDKDIERLLLTLDQTVGKDNYVVFLTADHGVPEIPQYMMKEKLPAGYLYHQAFYKSATAYLNTILTSAKWIDTLINDQFYLNRTLIAQKGLNLKTVQSQLADYLQQQKGVAFVYTASQLNESEFTTNSAMRIQNGFQPKCSGDVLLVLESGFFEYEDGAVVEHGSGYSYDTNVPLIWYGQNIAKGESWKIHYITDIAPTLSMLLRIKYPSACIGNPILEIEGK